MAQWIGQYTGNTHSTKVRDLEDTLRHAVRAFEDASPEKVAEKKRAVDKLALKVLKARLKYLKAKLDDMQPVSGSQRVRSTAIENLEDKIAVTEKDGTRGILREFGVQAADLD